MMVTRSTRERRFAAGGRRGWRSVALRWAAIAWLATTWASSAFATGLLPSARVLGVDEGILNFCAPKDPTAAQRLRQKIGELLQGTSPEQVSELRNSEDYRRAYDAVSEFAGKIDAHNVAHFCSESANERK